MLILLIVNFLIRSGRLDNTILVVKRAYKRGSSRFARAALLLMLFIVAAPKSFSGNSALTTLFHNAPEALPVPHVKNMLFYLQRDPDANTVVYQLNVKNGELNKEEPVSAFWIRYADKGEVKELSAIQRKLAYGINAKAMGNGKHELKFVSYPKLPLYLVKENTGDNYKVLALIQQKQIVLNKIFVRVKEGQFLFPKVEYVELSGKDSETGIPIVHRINI